MMFATAIPFFNAYQSDTALRMKNFCLLSLIQTAFCLLYDTLQFQTSKEIPVKAHTKLFQLLIDNAAHALSACLGWIIVLNLQAPKFSTPVTAVHW